MRDHSPGTAREAWNRIDRDGSDTSLRSVIALDDDAEARTGAVSDGRGPLAGVPVLVKDNIEALGLPCTAGSLALAPVPVTRDATLVARLRAAGAVVVGAANLSEWANIRSTRSSSGWSAVGGLTANPWALDRSPGGSSAGSGAAVAAGIVPMAVGTETDGSIVCPAALNGVVGIKPPVGMVPTDGVVPVSSSQDTPGPIAVDVDTAEAMLAVLADDATLPARSRSVDVSALRLGVATAWMTGHTATDALFDDVVRRIERRFGSLGSVEVPSTPEDVHHDEFTVLVHDLRTDLDAYLASRVPVGADAPRSLPEVVEFNRRNADRELAHFGQELFEMAADCDGRRASDYAATRARNLAWARDTCLGPALSGAEMLISPAYMPAWKTDFVLGHPNAGGSVTTAAAIAGFPIVCVPMGLVDGLPVGLALVGGPNGVAELIAAARVIERELALVDDPQWRPTFRPPARG